MLRLGIDIGTNSIGWWLYSITEGKPSSIVDGGVRIFSDGRVAKTGASLAVDRRNARAMRRRRDRYLQRRAMLMKRLAGSGLMPVDPVEAKALTLLDPHALRALGLDEKLPLTYLGRALFHLDQRRGFKSNRKTDFGDNEGGKIKDGTARLDQAMLSAGARTYGEFLHKRRATAPDPRHVPSVRTRLTLRQSDGSEKPELGYDYYPDRHHLEDEFQKLWLAQGHYYPELTKELGALVFETIFYQRPLAPAKVGRCLFNSEPRLPKAHPLTQQRVMYETVNSLRIPVPGQAARPLRRDERDTIILALNSKEPLKSPGATKIALKTLAKVLRLRDGQSFTLETTARDAIACDPVRASLAHPDRFGPRWSVLPEADQIILIDRLRIDTDREDLVAWIQKTHALDAIRAGAVADAPLPEGYSRLGETATRAILSALKTDVLTYDKAVAACGLNHHSNRRTGEVLDALPYYGEVLDRHVIPGSQDPAHDDITRYGRITNPTVHIGLNQLRRLVNCIIKVHGKPDQIVVELARDLKQNEDQKREESLKNARNLRAAELRREKLGELGQPDTGANRIILRLWEEMNTDPMRRYCPYTGTLISAGMLFTGQCDIDHILPYSRTLDDSTANRTLCLRKANREKRNKSPWEAWGSTAAWAKIDANLTNLPDAKRWRFAADAMARYEGERDFLDRALVDTQYLSRIAREYLDTLFTEGGHVWVVPGRLTEMLRRHWGLNSLLPDKVRGAGSSKNRLDHRHHAIDAAVIGATDRGLIQKIATMSGQNRENGLEEFAAAVPAPWESFRTDIAEKLTKIIVSHRADHGRIGPAARTKGNDSTSGRLHNETAYGLTGETSNGLPMVVSRKPIDTLTRAMLEKIRDPHLIHELSAVTEGKEGKDLFNAIRAFSDQAGPYQGIRRIRIIEPLEVIKIRDRHGVAYKGYKGDSNQFYEVWRLPDGKFHSWVVSTFDAHRGDTGRPHPAAKRVLRLCKNDMVRLDRSKFGPVIATVERFNVNGQISMVPHNESNADQRYRKDKEDLYIRMQASALMAADARRVMVDEMGRLNDPREAK